ncbi:MAG: RNA polymerase sigma-54 factor, partial [Bacilli bacterium]
MLLKALDQRRKTMTIVTEAIVSIQTEFLSKGEQYLKPLTLKQIAEMVDLHESTISRATQHKYVQTPQGVFEFKRFFASGLTTDSGEMTSSAVVKIGVKELIDNENKRQPLSDEKIKKHFNEKGIHISRRTVTKYREELGLVNSKLRVQHF